MGFKFRESNENGLHMYFTCDAFPVQAEGEVDGDKFYFRARWGEIGFNVASNPADSPVSVSIGEAEGFRFLGEYDEGDGLPLDEAEAFIRVAADEYRAWKTRAGER